MKFDAVKGIPSVCFVVNWSFARSVVERASRRNQVRIHKLPKNKGQVETLFITHKAQVSSNAMERLLEVIARQRRGDVRNGSTSFPPEGAMRGEFWR
jgi:hypothetical protein